jgi:tetratricopeptide (TPR) repeat protein
MSKPCEPLGRLARILRLTVPVDLLLAFCLSANAVETATQRCEQATNLDTAIEACSSIIQTDKDPHRLAMAYFNRAGWHLKKDAIDRAVSDLNEAVRFEPDFAAALTKRGLVEERSTIFEAPELISRQFLSYPQPKI